MVTFSKDRTWTKCPGTGPIASWLSLQCALPFWILAGLHGQPQVSWHCPTAQLRDYYVNIR